MELKPGCKQTEVGMIPEEWEVKRLGDAAEVVMGQSPPGSSYNRNGVGPPLINGPTEFTDNHPIKYQWTSEPTRLCRNGDLLLCVRGSSTGRINISDDEYCIGRGVAAIRAKRIADTSFVNFQVHSAIQSILATTTGSTFPNVDRKAICAIEILLPPIPEQRAIAAALFDVDVLIASLDKLIAKKRDIKQAAMQQLLTGQTRLPGFSGEWVPQKLRSIVCDFVVPMRDKPKRFSGDIPWCRIEDFDGKYLTGSRSGQYVDEHTVREMNLKIFSAGTLLVSCSADLGRCAIVGRPLVTNQTFIGLVLNESVSSNEFMYYYMSSNLFSAHLDHDFRTCRSMRSVT